jgi:hypothetical protein
MHGTYSGMGLSIGGWRDGIELSSATVTLEYVS